MLFITGTSKEKTNELSIYGMLCKTNELSIYGMLCRSVSIFYLQNLSSIFQVQEKLKACVQN